MQRFRSSSILHMLFHIYDLSYIVIAHHCHIGKPMTSVIELSPITLFKCLSDETRARLIFLIAQEQELCVCELTCALDLSQPKISRHLAQLRACGLLLDRRAGQWVYYQIAPDLPAWIKQVISLSGQAYDAMLASDTSRLSAMDGRPQKQPPLCC